MVILCADVLTVKQAISERLLDLKAKQDNPDTTATGTVPVEQVNETESDCIVSHKEFRQYECARNISSLL